MTDEQILDLLEQARLDAPCHVGYRHKKTGDHYHIRDYALREHDLVPCVVYCRFVAGGFLVFTRPVADFLERFERVY